MCGIAGALVFQTEKKITNRLNKIQLVFNKIMFETVDRGKHATGISLCGWEEETNNPYYGILKGPYSCEDFMFTEGDENPSRQTYTKIMKLWRKMGQNVSAVIGHCRFKTQGDEYDNLNNHPIVVPMDGAKIVGVHNGKVVNDHILFRELGIEREGLVDSEAIFKVMHHIGMGEEPPTLDQIDEATKYIDGEYAVVGYLTKYPNLIFTYRYKRPLEFAVCKELDAIFISSETKFFKAAFGSLKRTSLSLGWDWEKIDFKDYSNIENDAYIFDTSKTLEEVNNDYGIHKLECVTKQSLSKTVYSNFRTGTGVNTRVVNRNTNVINNNTASSQRNAGVHSATGVQNIGIDNKKEDEEKAKTAKSETKNLPVVIQKPVGEPKEIKTNPKIHDRSGEDKAPLTKASNKEVIAEVIKPKEKSLSDIATILAVVQHNIGDAFRAMKEEVIAEFEGDPTTMLGSLFDSTDNFKKSGELDIGAVKLVEVVYTTVVQELVEYIKDKVNDCVDDAISEAETDLENILVDKEDNNSKVDIDAYKKVVQKEIAKRQKAQNRIRALTEMIVAILGCRKPDAKNIGKLEAFVEKNMPDRNEEKKKIVFDIMTMANESTERYVITKALNTALGEEQ